MPKPLLFLHSAPRCLTILALLVAGLSTGPDLAGQVSTPVAAAARLDLSHVSPAALTAFQAGLAEVTMGRSTEAVPHLAEALRLAEGFGVARAFHALYAPMPMAERTRELDRAVADALQAGSGHAAVALALRASRLSETATSPALFRAARALFPGDSLIAWLTTFLPGGQPAATITDRAAAARRFSEAYPNWAAGQLQLGLSLDATGDTRGGVTALFRAIELNPSAPQPHLLAGNLLRKEGRYEEALAHYRHYGARGGDVSTARNQVAITYQLQGRGSAARQEFADALATATTPSERAGAHRMTGLSHALEGNWRLAEAAQGEAIEAAGSESPVLAATHREMAMVSALAGNRRDVTRHLAAAGAPSPATMAQHAMLFAAAGMNLEATAAADSAAGHAGAAPSQLVAVRLAMARALVHINNQDGDDALEEVARAGTSPMVHAVWALAEQLRGQTAAARFHRERVVSWPNFMIANLEQVLARRLVDRVR